MIRRYAARAALFACVLALPVVSHAAAPRPEDPAPPNSATAHLHDDWDAILRAHVHGGRVDYVGLATRDMSKLDRYLRSLAAVQADTLPGPDRVAYWLNLYNSTMVRAVCARYHESWRPDADAFAVFKAPIVRTADGSMPLDVLEHTVLRRRVPDPRIHAALCCAAVSCPPLQPRAYRGATVDSLLEVDMGAFVNDPARNRFDNATRTMTLSRVFDWYLADIGGSSQLPAFLEHFSGRKLAGWKVAYAEYDWALNIVKAGSTAPGAPDARKKK
jgi:hypothetical protein